MAGQSDLVIQGLIKLALEGDQAAAAGLRRIVAETHNLNEEQRKQLAGANLLKVTEQARVDAERIGAEQAVKNGKLRASTWYAAIKAAEEAKKKENELTDATKKTASEVEKLRKEFLGLEHGILEAIGGRELIKFAKESFEEFVKLDRQITATKFVLDQLGLDGEGNIKRILHSLEEIGTHGGVLMDETVAAFQGFVGITKDVDAALALVALANDAAASKTVDFSAAVAGLSQILVGRAGLAARTFKIDVKNAEGALDDSGQILEIVKAKFGGLAKSVHDTASEVQTQKAKWEAFRIELGEQVAPVFIGIGKAIYHLVAVLKDAGAFWGTVIDQMITQARNFASVAGAAFDLKKAFTSPKEYAAAFEAAWDKIGRDGKLAAEVLKEAFEKNHGVTIGETPEERARRHDEEVEAERKQQEALAVLIEEAHAKTRAARAKAEADAYKEARTAAIEAELSTINEASDRALKLRLEKLRLEREAAVREVDAKNSDISAINKQFDHETIEAKQKLAAATVEVERTALQQRINLLGQERVKAIQEAEQKNTELIRITAQFNAKELAIRKAHEQAVQAAGQADLDRTARKYEKERDASEAAEKKLLQFQIEQTAEGSDERFELERQLRDENYRERLRGEAEVSAEASQIRLAWLMETINAELNHEKQKIDQRLALEQQAADAEAALRDAMAQEALSKLSEDSTARFDILRQRLLDEEAEQVASLERRKKAEDDLVAIGKKDAKVAAKEKQTIDTQIATVHSKTTAGITKLDKAEAESRKDNFLTATGLIIGALQDAFGEHKALAIAAALINTYEGVTKAIAQGGFLGLATAAVVAAAGLAQVAKIRSTTPGSGGGDAGITTSGPLVPAPPPPVTRPPEGAAPSVTNISNSQTFSSPTQIVAPTGLTRVELRRNLRRQRRAVLGDPRQGF